VELDFVKNSAAELLPFSEEFKFGGIAVSAVLKR